MVQLVEVILQLMHPGSQEAHALGKEEMNWPVGQEVLQVVCPTTL